MLTTQLRQIKSYPTYQLHAYTRSSSSAAEDMFRICILETMKWLRSRLSRFDTLPEQIMLPEPENYDLLSFDMLQSFSLSFLLKAGECGRLSLRKLIWAKIPALTESALP